MDAARLVAEAERAMRGSPQPEHVIAQAWQAYELTEAVGRVLAAAWGEHGEWGALEEWETEYSDAGEPGRPVTRAGPGGLGAGPDRGRGADRARGVPGEGPGGSGGPVTGATPGSRPDLGPGPDRGPGPGSGPDPGSGPRAGSGAGSGAGRGTGSPGGPGGLAGGAPRAVWAGPEAPRAARLTGVRDPAGTLRALRTLLGEIGHALVVITCTAEDESAYWQCVEALDAVDEAKDRVRALARADPG